MKSQPGAKQSGLKIEPSRFIEEFNENAVATVVLTVVRTSGQKSKLQ